MVLKKWSDERATDYGMNGNSAKFLTMAGTNTIRQLIDRAGVWSAGSIEGWGDAYIDADGREGSVSTTNTNATFDTNKYKVATTPTVYVEITATSLTPADFAINNCVAIPHIDGGKWLIVCTSGTDAVKRAQIMKTLFYGSNGTDARIKNTYITGITALKTNSATDVNKRAWYIMITRSEGSTSTIERTGTFADTSTNTNMNSWSYVSVSTGTTVDETGIDTVADNKTNPATCQLHIGGANSETNWEVPDGTVLNQATKGSLDNKAADARAYFLSVGNVSFGDTGTPATSSTIDFYTTHSVPLITDGSALDLSDYLRIVYHTIPANTFSSTPSKAIGVPLIADWETGADIQYKLKNASEDSGWLSCSNSPAISSFTAFTSTPTILLVKLIPKSSSPSAGYPSIKGFWCYCD